MKVFLFVLCMAATGGLSALDTSVSNEFWCTWNYVNASTNTAAAVSSQLEIDTKTSDCRLVEPSDDFDTRPCGAMIVIR